MAIASEDLRFRVLAQVIGAQSINGLKNSVDGIGKSANSMSGSLKFLSNSVKALGVAFVAQQGFQFAKGILDTADNLSKLSQKAGVSVKDLSGFKAAADLADVSTEALTGGLRKLATNAVDAAGGGKLTSAAFRAIGVAVKDANGQIRPTGDLLKDVADKFVNIKDGPEKAAIAVKLFGKAGTDLIPLLNGGSDSLTKFGLAIDDDFAGRAEAFNDTITRIGLSIQNSGISALSDLLPTFQEVGSALEKFAKSTEGDGVGIMDGLGEGVRLATILFTHLYTEVLSGTDALVTLGKVITNAVVVAFSYLGDQLKTRSAQLKAFITGDFAAVNQLGDDLAKRGNDRDKKIIDGTVELYDGFTTRVKARRDAANGVIKDLAKNSLLFGEGSVDEIKKRQRDATKPETRKGGSTPDVSGLATAERDRVKEFIEQQKLESEQRELALGDINLTSIELLKVTEARKLEAEAIKAGKTLTAEQRKELMGATEELIKQRSALIDLEQAQKRSFTGGLKTGLRAYADEATNVGKQIEDSVKKSFGAMEDALLGFVKTGKANFKDLANSIIDDLIRIAIRKGITGPLADGLGSLFSVGGPSSAVASTGTGIGGFLTNGFANGGIMTGRGSVPLRKYAGGGVARSPQLALFGEGSRPEAFVPLPDGRNIPVKMDGSGGDNYQINVSVASDGSTQSSGGNESGKILGQLVASAVQAELVKQKRPGGILA